MCDNSQVIYREQSDISSGEPLRTPSDLEIGDYQTAPTLWPQITSGVLREDEELRRGGLDIDVVNYDPAKHSAMLASGKQQEVNSAIDRWSSQAAFAEELFDKDVHPSGDVWHGIAKSAVSLLPFYAPNEMRHPKAAIDPGFLDIKLFDGADGELVSARQVSELRGGGAEESLKNYESFFALNDLKDKPDKFGLTTYDYLSGSLDRIADVTRAQAGIEIIKDHLAATRPTGELVSASLACGTAEPIFWLANELRDNGVEVAKIHLVDSDPVALAVSALRADKNLLGDKIDLHLNDLLREKPADYLGAKSADFVDLIGLFEYMRMGKNGTGSALRILQRAAEITKPGGIIVFGNMLKDRPQQKWFSEIWPPLQQRSVSDVIEIVEAAGFSRDQLKVRIPTEGVYAVYGLEIPAEDNHPIGRSQIIQALGHQLTN